MPEFSRGDRVYVTDPDLAQLRNIMRSAGHEPFPNHHGTVAETWADGTVLIHFDNEDGHGQGSGAPYPPHKVRHLPSSEEPPYGR